MIQRVFEHALFSTLRVQMCKDLKIGQRPWNWQQCVSWHYTWGLSKIYPLISMHLFCPRKSEESGYFSKICEYSYISRHSHSQRLYTNLQTFGHPSHHFGTCMPTISKYFITCLCTISTHFQIFDAISIRHTNICRTFGNTWTPVPSILQHS